MKIMLLHPPGSTRNRALTFRVRLMADLQGVVGAGHVQDLGQGVDIHPQRHGTIALEPGEKRGGESDG